MDTAVGKQVSFMWKSVRRRVYQEEGAGNKETGRAEGKGAASLLREGEDPAIFVLAAARLRAAFYTREVEESCRFTSTVAPRGTSTSVPKDSMRLPSTAARPAAAAPGGRSACRPSSSRAPASTARTTASPPSGETRSEEHTSELQ